jgi:hypothetical protein
MSLARDYLAIMAASVSSERAFSQGGITITKHRNRLKGDIVEALQCVKCSIRLDLIFRAPAPSSLVEEFCEDGEVEGGSDGAGAADEVEEDGWDAVLIDSDEDDLSMSDVDDSSLSDVD